MSGLEIVLSLGLVVAAVIAIYLFFTLLGRIEALEKRAKNVETAMENAPSVKSVEGKLTMHHQLQTATLPAKFEITKRKY